MGLAGQDSKLLAAVLKWAVLMLALACLVVGLLQGVAAVL